VGDIRAGLRVSLGLVRRDGEWDSRRRHPAEGDQVVVVAPIAAHVRVREALGPELPDAEARALRELHTVDVVVRRQEAAGRSLQQLLSRLGPGLFPNAVFRAGEPLQADGSTVLQLGDVLRVTGTEPHIAELGKSVGRVVRASHASDVLTLAIGLLIGAALGAIPVPLFGVSISFGATAVLLTGIVYGWLKTRHPAFGGPISEGARQLAETLGLNVFTAVLAVNSGAPCTRCSCTGRCGRCAKPLISGAGSAGVVDRARAEAQSALLMGAVAGARQAAASMQSALKRTDSSVPGVGYPCRSQWRR
jgi:putative transport protein